VAAGDLMVEHRPRHHSAHRHQRHHPRVHRRAVSPVRLVRPGARGLEGDQVINFAPGGSHGAARRAEPPELTAARDLAAHQISNAVQAPFGRFQQPVMGHAGVEGKSRAGR
jgi:hypothetical protein